MPSPEKSTSDKTLSVYFQDLSTVSVPTTEEETKTFRHLISIEARLIAAVLAEKGADIALRTVAAEDQTVLPVKLCNADVVCDEALRFIRSAEAGRKWLRSRTDGRLIPRDVRQLLVERDSIKNQYVAANLRLTVMIAKKYVRRCHHQSISDLIQEGNLGLMKAVDRFDPDRGFKFATYAVWWIRHHIKRAISDCETTVRFPVHISELAIKLSRLDAIFMTENGEGMDVPQMMKATSSSFAKVTSAVMSRNRVVHVDAPAVGEEGVSLVETMASDSNTDPLDALQQEELREEMCELLAGLAPFESRVLRLRFGMDGSSGMTLQEIAERYGLSRERIRQVEAKAIRKLQGRLRGKSFQAYVSASA